jgi:hypothetical protein
MRPVDRPFYITIEPYRRFVTVAVVMSPRALKVLQRKHSLAPSSSEGVYDAYTAYFKSCGLIFVYLGYDALRKETGAQVVATVAHEAVHVKQKLEEYFNEHDGFSMEAEAYLVGYLVEQISEMLHHVDNS